MALRRLAIGTAVAVCSCGLVQSSVDITGATLLEDGVTIQLNVDACTRNASASVVEETSEEVVVLVRASLRGGDCGLGINVTLENPLGERDLIDSHDNQTIEVAR
jgi:hypothetical protein